MPGSGKSFRGPCPIHGKQGEKDRSLAVNLTKNVYCCHHCGSSGNALDLWAASMSLPLLEAAWDLIQRLDIEPPLLNRKEELSDAK
jgi:DNA primase